MDRLALREKQAARPGYALLGVLVKPVTTDIAATIGLPDPAGVVVVEVVPGSPADMAGIPAPGDIVFQVGGAEVNTQQQFRALIGEAVRADNVVILLRDAQSGKTGYMEVPLR